MEPCSGGHEARSPSSGIASGALGRLVRPQVRGFGRDRLVGVSLSSGEWAEIPHEVPSFMLILSLPIGLGAS